MERNRVLTASHETGGAEAMRYPVFLLVGFLLTTAGCFSKSIRQSASLDNSGDTQMQPDTIVADTLSDTIPHTADVSRPDSQYLSNAALLMIQSCDNYVQINPDAPKVPEVLLLKASVYFNNDLFEKSRSVYQLVVEDHSATVFAVDAVRMIAQSYYKEKKFEKAQQWYRRLRDMASEEGGRSEAIVRIAESIFRMAEEYESQQQFEKAASEYERIALEFPDSKIADVSLFNAGLCYEKLSQWSRAVLMYQRLNKRYEGSDLVTKSMFRMAKAHEKMQQWEDAARMYLKLVSQFPQSEFSETSLYNAGFSFENAGLIAEAAATFEKLALSFPQSGDAPDIVFKAGELYGRVKDWEAVTRVNTLFTQRYGGDTDRAVQAQCMVGIALYMQDKTGDALNQLQRAITTYERLKNPSTANKFYAARAQFTIAEIYHEQQNNITLKLPRSSYQKHLREKSTLLDKAVEAYSSVIPYNISEWTTRTIFQIGQTYEDFAMGVFEQQRPEDLDIEQSLSLELGIAQAVEEYFVEHALHYHEQNVQLGLKENIEDKHIVNSKKKLTYLPYMAGDNYLSLVEIAGKANEGADLEGVALIAKKLRSLQRVAPFQERAIELFLKALELGSKYRETNTFYEKASSLITGTSFTVGKTYAEVVDIAREAPIPEGFDPYDRFVYKTKLLKQIENYEDNALTNYLKGLKIAEAYSLTDPFVEQSKTHIAELLYQRGRSYDLLFLQSFTSPPFPSGTSQEEQNEYRARFEEIGLRFQDQALDIYRSIIDYAQNNYARGEFVNHAYVRLYQNYPREFGVEHESIVKKSISTGSKWKVTPDSSAHWQRLNFDDVSWKAADKSSIDDSIKIIGFPDSAQVHPMWFYPQSGSTPSRLFFRRVFYLSEPPHEARLYVAANTFATVYLNGDLLDIDSASAAAAWHRARVWELTGQLRRGKNVLALFVENYTKQDFSAFPYLDLTISQKTYLPRFPGTQETIPREIVEEDAWVFPDVPNFSFEEQDMKE